MTFRTGGLALALLAALIPGRVALGAPKPDLWPYWQAHDPGSRRHVDHAAWDAFLGRYVVTDHPSGINRVRYGAVTEEDRSSLDGYLRALEAVKVTELARPEQKAYWINLYNALTVEVVLDHYPVESIREIRSGFFTPGPWELELARVEGRELTLNDIEHRILRPIFRDNRVHYAVNCASLGCPNLQPVAFTAERTEQLLARGARAYVNHPRGVHFEDGDLVASSIYDWFQVDFGGSEEGVVSHLRRYAEGPLAHRLDGFDGTIRYRYDWTLNEP